MRPLFNYNTEKLPRETKKHYISTNPEETISMLKDLGLSEISQVFKDLPENIKYKNFQMVEGLEYEELADHLYKLSKKNKTVTSFLGDGLQRYSVSPIIEHVCAIRALTTAYTPYQPERSQGTLKTLWIYQSALAQLTGFEAINASLYDRSTCLFEALNCALRLKKKKNKILISELLQPEDKKVLYTLVKNTNMELVEVDYNPETGLTNTPNGLDLSDVAGFAFAQINSLGLIDRVDELTDFCTENDLASIAIIDPILLASKGLKKPSIYGSHEQGTDMIVGEGQHLAIDVNFGGPGIGIFGIRFNEKNKLAIRSTAGRFVGRALDLNGKDCLSMVLSTREQHIRREKATSNICSNQSFIATIVGASILSRGDEGLGKMITIARNNTLTFLKNVLSLEGVNLKFQSPFFNEVVLETTKPASGLIELAQEQNLLIGVSLEDRTSETNLLKVSFNDTQQKEDVEKLIHFFKSQFSAGNIEVKIPEIPISSKRVESSGIPRVPEEELKHFYDKLGEQNISPDHVIYPLGSCTMKYNPYINDWAAGLEGFTNLHPQTPEIFCQGSLELMYNCQELFKSIHGMPGVVTQPVAGAQGELVGLKMFQAYHENKGEDRDIILIPKSAHGTNPATATMAGFETNARKGHEKGVVLIDADSTGRINMEQIRQTIKDYGTRIAGIMVTNPNTAGIFETNFKEMADLIHEIDGLVYMDGANMNAIAGQVDIGALGVDAIHNNLHKTWTIPHGGGGPGDAIVAVSEKLLDYMPGRQVIKNADGSFSWQEMKKSIGSFHRHHGNFAHKVRAYTYLMALGTEGVKNMSAYATLSAQYLHHHLSKIFPTLPYGAEDITRMHEFIITLSEDDFKRISESGTAKSAIVARIGKLFLDFGLHAPTVAFPEIFGLMIEPTESFSKSELDSFIDVLKEIRYLLDNNPEVLQTAPHFTPIDRVDEVAANKNLVLSESLRDIELDVMGNRISPHVLQELDPSEVTQRIISAAQK